MKVKTIKRHNYAGQVRLPGSEYHILNLRHFKILKAIKKVKEVKEMDQPKENLRIDDKKKLEDSKISKKGVNEPKKRKKQKYLTRHLTAKKHDIFNEI